MRRLFRCGLMLAAWRVGVAQVTIPAVGELLPRIYDYSERYSATLPSLSCDEAILSQVVHNGVVRKEVKIESTLREVRTGAKEFTEKHEFRTLDGVPVSGVAKIPYFVQGVLPMRSDLRTGVRRIAMATLCLLWAGRRCGSR